MPNVLDLLSNYTIGTPDFGHSDVWHFNLALKFLLSTALKAGSLPLWSKDIGTGFPILGEGQIGMFNLYNFLAFKFLNPVLAFNLGFLIIYLTIASGTYAFSRAIKLTKLASLFTATIFSLCGLFITQMVHFNLIQSASLLPWEFFLTEKFLQTNRKRYLLVLAFVVQQQIFSGFQQMTFISLSGISLYVITRSDNLKKIKQSLALALSIALGFALATPQLLPTWQLLQNSLRSPGVAVNVLAGFPYLPQNLIGFISPYFFGDPRIGTYPPYSDNWGIFWESTGYIGIIPLFLVAIALLQKNKNHYQKTFLVILVVSLILLLGKSTPFFFVFQLPPLSFFRVPARFLFLFVWSLTILSGIALSSLPKKLGIIILIVSLADLLNFDLKYHPITNVTKWLAPPETVAFLKKDTGWFRVYSLNAYNQWNLKFLASPDKKNYRDAGWQEIDSYFPLRNALDPNQNLYWGISSSQAYTGMLPRRFEIFDNLTQQGIKSNLTEKTVAIDTKGAKLLSLTAVKYLITALPLTNFGRSNLSIPVTSTSSNPQYLLYQNPNVLPHAYLTRNYVVAGSVSDLTTKLTDPDLTSVILEEDIDITPDPNDLQPAAVIDNHDLSVVIKATASAKSLLVLSDSFYPGWQATVDNLPAKIYPANLNQRAVIVPKGEHIVKFQFDPLQIF